MTSVNGIVLASNGAQVAFTTTNLTAGNSYVMNISFHYYNGQLYVPIGANYGGYGVTRTTGTYTAISPSGGGFTLYLSGLGANATDNIILHGFKGILYY